MDILIYTSNLYGFARTILHEKSIITKETQ